VSRPRPPAGVEVGPGSPLPHGPGTSRPPGPATVLPMVQAAGAVCWRPARGGDDLEVLLVHNARHGEWSWPKGKAAVRESLPECALREVSEETGVLALLGRPLGTVAYHLRNGRPKTVTYWAGRPTATRRPTADTDEIDDRAWVDPDKAERMLAHRGDLAPLDRLLALAREGTLDTRPFVVVRHGQARPRDAWSRADAERPLVAKGRRQALAISGLLQCWRPSYLVSSPWRRCTETMGPYAAASGTRLRTKGSLTEDGFHRNPHKVVQRVNALLRRDQPSLLCTHRPLLGAVVDTLAAAAPDDARDGLPAADPWLRPGELLVAHVARGLRESTDRVVAVERFSPG